MTCNEKDTSKEQPRFDSLGTMRSGGNARASAARAPARAWRRCPWCRLAGAPRSSRRKRRFRRADSARHCAISPGMRTRWMIELIARRKAVSCHQRETSNACSPLHTQASCASHADWQYVRYYMIKTDGGAGTVPQGHELNSPGRELDTYIFRAALAPGRGAGLEHGWLQCHDASALLHDNFLTPGAAGYAPTLRGKVWSWRRRALPHSR